MDVTATADHGREHWLAVAEEQFVPATSGGRVETLNLLKAVGGDGVRLHIIVPDLGDEDSLAAHESALPGQQWEGIPRTTTVRSHLSFQPYIFRSRPLPQGLLKSAQQVHERDRFDVVLAASFRVAHVGLALANTLDVPLVIRPHNLESGYFEELARNSGFPRSLAYRAEAMKVRRAEAALHSAAGITLFADISRSDAERRAAVTRTPVIHVPPFVDTARSDTSVRSRRRDADASCTLLFLGALDFPLNVAAVQWFIQHCWPALRLREKAVALHIVGRRAPRGLVDQLVDGGARVTTDAAEVTSLLSEADVFINPVQGGSGVNIKMVEAMQAGLPVVSTSAGARGLSWRDGQHLLVADSAEHFSSAVGRLVDDLDLRQALGSAAREFVRTELDGPRHIRRIRYLTRPAIDVPGRPPVRVAD